MKGSQVDDDTILAVCAYNDTSGVAENGVSVSAKLVPGSGDTSRATCSTSSRTAFAGHPARDDRRSGRRGARRGVPWHRHQARGRVHRRVPARRRRRPEPEPRRSRSSWHATRFPSCRIPPATEARWPSPSRPPAPVAEAPAPARRLTSLDAVRGLAVAGMVLVENLPGPIESFRWLRHDSWHGLTVADVVFPLFLVRHGRGDGAVAAPAGQRADAPAPRRALARPDRDRTPGLRVVG